MRQYILLGAILLAAGCGQQGPRDRYNVSEERVRTMDVQSEPGQPSMLPPPPPAAPPPEQTAAPVTVPMSAPAIPRSPPPPPNVSPSAAPGVAFNYRYAFRLPAARVSQIQEQHARACEQLGVSR